MRCVIDTNILVSAALKQVSIPALALSQATARGTLLKSGPTEQQLFEVLARPRFAALIPDQTRDRLRRLYAAAELVTISERISACRDPTDDKFLELAVNGNADFIITGDADLLILHPFRGIPIISAATFITDHMQ